jgi:hypothetical protein
MTREQAISRAEAHGRAEALQMARQCETGRHVIGCAHRPVSPWVARALGMTLPPSAHGARAYDRSR